MADLDQWDEDVPSFDEAWLCNEDEEPCETDENQTGVKEDIPVPSSNKGEDQVMNKNDEATKHSASWKKPLVITGGVLVMGFALIIGYQMCSSKTEEDLVLNNIGSSDPLVNTPPPNRSAAFDPLTGESIEDLADEQKGENPAPVAAVDVEKEEASTESEPVSEPLPPAQALTAIEFDENRMVVLADGVIANVKHFTMKAPPRLVIDFPGVKTLFKNHSFPAPQGWKAVRIGRDDRRVRVVLEGPGDNLLEHTVNTVDDKLIVEWAAKPVAEAATTDSVREGMDEVDKERLAFLERERVSLRRQLQTERNRTRRLQQEARSLSAKTDQQASRIEELRSTVATLKNRPILPPGWQVVGLTTQQVIFSDGSKTYVVRVGEAVHGLKVQSVDIENGRITTNYGVVDISRNGKS